MAAVPVSCHHGIPAPQAAEAAGAKKACPTCAGLKEAWPSIVEAAEAAVTSPDAHTAAQNANAVLARLQAVETSGCPLWRRRAQEERAQLLDLLDMHSTLHAADGSATADAALEKRFWRLHNAACVEASKASAGGFAVWAEGKDLGEAERRQRYVVNLPFDAAAVDAQGTVGGKAQASSWTGLVLTPVLAPVAGRLGVLQGQGPRQDKLAQAYVQGAVRYAQAHHLGQVLFVNAAGGQVQSFATTVSAEAAPAQGMDLQYMELTDWSDGALVTPQRAAQLAVGIADRLTLQQGPSLLVVNCNAGLDRSGTLNALVQLVALTQQRLHEGVPKDQAVQEATASIDTVVAQLKSARAHAISSPARYAFLHAAFLAYAQSLTPVSAPAGGAAR